MKSIKFSKDVEKDIINHIKSLVSKKYNEVYLSSKTIKESLSVIYGVNQTSIYDIMIKNNITTKANLNPKVVADDRKFKCPKCGKTLSVKYYYPSTQYASGYCTSACRDCKKLADHIRKYGSDIEASDDQSTRGIMFMMDELAILEKQVDYHLPKHSVLFKKGINKLRRIMGANIED